VLTDKAAGGRKFDQNGGGAAIPTFAFLLVLEKFDACCIPDCRLSSICLEAGRRPHRAAGCGLRCCPNQAAELICV